MKRNLLLALGFVSVVITLYLIFVWVPTITEMGIVERIFYLMVPMGWLALLAFVVTFAGSVLFLVKKQDRWDFLARSSAEIGIVFTTVTLFIGAIWAKPIWGVWWTWEARLTATMILWFIYLSYFVVRSFATDEHRGAVFAAVVAIVGLVDVPIIALSTTLWRGMHPPALVFKGDIAPEMLLVMLTSVGTFTILYVFLLMLRVSVRRDEAEVQRLKELDR
ncbi:MAG: cytochrome c biogenesis protein CcsA [Chloroflexi bacterium]|nr:cytochrome c biogenesis protein CcsA [Chloroflexota bacterium]